MSKTPKKGYIKGIWDEVATSVRDKFGDQISQLDEETRNEVRSKLSDLDKNEIKSLINLIRERRGYIDTSPAYNNEVVNASKQILSFGAAGFAIVAAFSRTISELPPGVIDFLSFVMVFYCDLVVTSIVTLLIFLWQSRFRYPFLYLEKSGNTLPFYYYKSTSHNTPREAFQSTERKMEGLRLYLEDYKKFVDEHKKYVYQNVDGDGINKESLVNQCIDEIQQYFLLIEYQGYVNQNEVKLTNLFIYGFVSSILSIILISFFYILLFYVFAG